MVLKTSGDTIERKEPPQANPGTIKAWDHSSGHARATDHQRHPLSSLHPAPMAPQRGATRPPTRAPSSRACPRFPRIIPCRPTSSKDSGAVELPAALRLSMHQDLCHCFVVLLSGCFVDFVLTVKFKPFSF